MRHLLAALMLLGAVPAFAADLSNVVRVYAGANGLVVDQNSSIKRDFEVGGTGTASLSPHIALVSGVWYGFDASYFRYSVGARVTATDVEDTQFSVGFGAQYQSANEEELKPSEWAPEVTFGYRPFGGPVVGKPTGLQRIIVGGQGFYGLTSKQARATASVRYLLPLF